MAEYTENYNLILPKETENYDVEVANTNNKAIDIALGGKVNKIIGKGLSTNDFTNEYKKKVDALQTLYRYKGNVETLTELSSKTNNNVGDVWKCEADGNNYCWNKIEWVNLGTDIDLSAYALKTELELKANKTELETKASKEELNELQTNTEQAIQDVADTIVTETATQETNGLMSKEDKIKLDKLQETIKAVILSSKPIRKY